MILIHKGKKKNMDINDIKSITPINDQLVKLVYGDTDSVVANTSITITNGKETKDIRVDDFFNLLNTGVIQKTQFGHEMIDGGQWRIKNLVGGKLTDSPIKRIIRHKVNKKIYRITSSDGKSVECTGDHSIIVMRDGKLIEAKPCDIKKTDKLVVYG